MTPPGIVTEDWSPIPVPFVFSVTTVPLEGAGAVSETLQLVAYPDAMLVGLHVNVLRDWLIAAAEKIPANRANLEIWVEIVFIIFILDVRGHTYTGGRQVLVYVSESNFSCRLVIFPRKVLCRLELLR
jgi:hypothetical protein